jgi:hypothetical protein
MQNEQRLLLKAKTNRKKENSGMRSSGFLLEELYQLRHPTHTRYPERSAYDFYCGNTEIDVKGCWASKYNGTIFIEETQNTNNKSQPAYIKDTSGKNIFLVYIDYDTGTEYWILWNKLKNKLVGQYLVNGGYSAKGWLVNILEHPDCIRTITK